MSQDDSATVAISSTWQNVYDRLCLRGQKQPGGQEWYIFNQMTALFTLSATIGYRHQKTGAISKVGRTLKWEWFDNKNERPILRALAWKISNDRSVLDSAKKVLDIVQPYAEGGMQALEDQVFKDFMNPQKELTIPSGNELERLLLAFVMKAAKYNPFGHSKNA